MMCFFHKWSKWEQYEMDTRQVIKGGETFSAVELRQKRTCKKCGKMQDNPVREDFS